VRILGLDIGSKRIGVAISDELGFTAQGLETLNCKSPEEDAAAIFRLTEKYNAEKIVVGIPYNMDGTEGPQAEKVRAIIETIKQRVTIPIREWDERLSTVAAERVLLEADMSRSKRRKVIDKLAAVLILQGYLDRQSAKEIPNS
jgi:putative holliday junction resolvase